MEIIEKEKSVYKFGNSAAEGNGQMKNLLGGKGANLEEMSLMGIPVPPVLQLPPKYVVLIRMKAVK